MHQLRGQDAPLQGQEAVGFLCTRSESDIRVASKTNPVSPAHNAPSCTWAGGV